MTVVSSSHPKAGEYNRRAKMRQGILALATIEGWTRIDVLEAFIRPDGSVIVIDTDNRRYVTGALGPLTSDETMSPPERSVGKKVCAPKSWAPEYWNKVAGRLRAGEYSRVEALDIIQESDKLDDKQKRQAVAVIEAMPDSPDWYEHVPLAES